MKCQKIALYEGFPLFSTVVGYLINTYLTNDLAVKQKFDSMTLLQMSCVIT